MARMRAATSCPARAPPALGGDETLPRAHGPAACLLRKRSTRSNVDPVLVRNLLVRGVARRAVRGGRIMRISLTVLAMASGGFVLGALPWASLGSRAGHRVPIDQYGFDAGPGGSGGTGGFTLYDAGSGAPGGGGGSGGFGNNGGSGGGMR
jgi:hypothetical protein